MRKGAGVMTYEPCERTPCLRSARTLARRVVFACALCLAVCAVCAAPFVGGLASTKAWAADPVPITTADELRAVPGQFTPSAFVASVTGVDNVCERAAVRASGGHLIQKKWKGTGVTFAVALAPVHFDWRW